MIVKLSSDLKIWPDKYSKEKNQSTAETTCEALREYKMKRNEAELQNILHITSGLWKGRKLNSQKYVRKIRDEYSKYK